VTLTFDLEGGVRVTCDLGYICANFSLPSHCSRFRPVHVVCTRQTDRRQTARRLIPSPIRNGHNNICSRTISIATTANYVNFRVVRKIRINQVIIRHEVYRPTVNDGPMSFTNHRKSSVRGLNAAIFTHAAAARFKNTNGSVDATYRAQTFHTAR